MRPKALTPAEDCEEPLKETYGENSIYTGDYNVVHATEKAFQVIRR